MKELGPIRTVLLCCLGSLGAGILLTGLLSLQEYHTALFVAAGLLGSGIGAITLEKSRKWVIGLLCGGLIAAILAGILCLKDGMAMIFLAIVYALSAGAAMVGGYGYYGPTGWWCLAILALAYLLGKHTGVLFGAMLLGLVLTLDGFRAGTMRKAQLKDQYARRLDNPAGILGYSVMLLCIMLPVLLGVGLLTMLLGNQLTHALGIVGARSAPGLLKVMTWIQGLILAFWEWFRSLFHFKKGIDSAGASGGYVPKQYSGGAGSWLLTILLVVATTVLLLSIAAGAGTILLRRQKRPREDSEVQDYIDEIERLERPIRKRRKWFQRKQRFDDFDSPAMKIRFAFQQLLRRREQTEPMACTKTPNELREQDSADADMLIDAYNRVKYGPGNVTEQELQAARRYVKGR